MCTCPRMSRSLACPERRSVRPTAPDPGGRRALHTPHCCGVVLSATRRVFGTLASAEAGATLRRTERTLHEVAALDPRGVFGALSPGDTNLRVVGGFPHAVCPARPPFGRRRLSGPRRAKSSFTPSLVRRGRRVQTGIKVRFPYVSSDASQAPLREVIGSAR